MNLSKHERIGVVVTAAWLTAGLLYTVGRMYYESSKHQSALDNCTYNISLDYRAGCKISADREYLFRTERVCDPVITMTFMTPLGWILALGASKSRKWIGEA